MNFQLVFIPIFATTAILIIVFMIFAASRDFSKRIALVKPGSIWKNNNEVQNPFQKDYHEYVILEAKNGYVLFQETKNLLKYTLEVGHFVLFYTLIQGIKT